MRPKNPYSELVKMMQDQGAKYNTPYVEIGVVVSASPLAVRVGDLQLDKNDLLIADYLLPDYARKYTANGNIQLSESGSIGSTTNSDTVTSININTDNTQTGDLTFSDGLNVNDVLALIQTLDGQTYIILARLVSP